MKSHALLAVATGLLLTAGALPQDEAGDRPDPIKGEWKLLATQDEKHTDPGCDQSTMTVQADGRVVFRLAERTTNRGTVKFGTSGNLRALDLKLADGETLLAVYEVNGDDLVICFAEAGKARPAATAPKGSQWVEKWKRARP
jgi:uncharacterized protein (TIGR03067 family)